MGRIRLKLGACCWGAWYAVFYPNIRWVVDMDRIFVRRIVGIGVAAISGCDGGR